ncbi:hypothetical protein GF359_06340 [candidate division WOR-3 bacterium]|uniref:ARG and Rhodanese-Phosphatase-superfamily-associated domain-containing protein n=1 Tax=candidate division WOR-3 bacterium TaxID=2052148 RepID=A0A9D5K999_UNCW3|nr:hypothetical protein [candidate division WOR-3 bacterium]MBD3364818.1 hypothetical protein [candidate division WOR-3 bacterium]
MKALTAILLLFWTTSSDQAELRNVSGKVTIMPGIATENLRIFPLTYSGSHKSFTPFSQALDKGWIVVSEKNEGEVNTILVKNKGNSTVFVMAGEVVKGAKQDRMIENDMLIPPKSDWLEVACYCTEHGRWSGTTKQFAEADINVSPSVRANARKEKDQSKVWEKVAENQEDILGAQSSTGAFRHIYEDKGYQTNRDNYYTKLKDLPEDNSSIKGVVVCVGEDILCVDLFGSNELLNHLWPKLLESYIVEAMRYYSKEDEGSVSLSEAKRFLGAYAEVDVKDEFTPGSGDLYEIQSRDAAGSALLSEGSLVHSDLFPD